MSSAFPSLQYAIDVLHSSYNIHQKEYVSGDCSDLTNGSEEREKLASTRISFSSLITVASSRMLLQLLPTLFQPLTKQAFIREQRTLRFISGIRVFYRVYRKSV